MGLSVISDFGAQQAEGFAPAVVNRRALEGCASGDQMLGGSG